MTDMISARCPYCGELFYSLESFDYHRTGLWQKRNCLTQWAMEASGYWEKADGRWALRQAYRPPDPPETSQNGNFGENANENHSQLTGETK